MVCKHGGVVILAVIVLLFSFIVVADDAAVVTNDPVVNDSANNSIPPPPALVPLSISVTANPLSGTAPLMVQFITASTGKLPLTYQWDFNNDHLADSSLQNPSYTFETAGIYNVSLLVTDVEGNTGSQNTIISVTTYDSGLNLSSYFPTTITKGQNQITFLVVNNGKDSLHDVSGKLIADGVQHLSSTAISLLRPGDQDSFTINAMFLKAGNISGIVKVQDKSFPLLIIVKEPISYNADELQATFQKIKDAFQKQESLYTDKKADGYLVTEIYDKVKLVQKQIQDVQQQLLTNKLADAKLSIDLTNSTLEDLTHDLENAKKEKQSPLLWVKDNAVALAAIVAASGTLSGVLIKVKNKASKLGENVKMKINTPARKKEDEEVSSTIASEGKKEEPKV